MFIPPEFSLTRETFGGINMDLSALQPLNLCKIREGLDMDVGTVQSPAVNVTMPGQRQGRRFPQQNQAVSADGHLHRR